MEELEVYKRDIVVCSHPECDGWAAKHLHDSVGGLWHEHNGERFDFISEEVVSAGDVLAAFASDAALSAFQAVENDPANLLVSKAARQKRALEAVAEKVMGR